MNLLEKNPKVLIIGHGSRENAIAWKCSTSKLDPKIFMWPGRGSGLEKGTPIGGEESNEQYLLDWCEENQPELIIIGPEKFLVNGLSDRLREAGFDVFGPSAAAAQLEGSKIFAKEVMQASGVPTPDFKEAANINELEEVLKSLPADWAEGVVVKLDGLAAGKGVKVYNTKKEALADLKFWKQEWKKNPEARVFAEEKLQGFEFSLFAICNGKNHIVLPFSKDYKRAFAGDEGPNTGGMGSFSPLPMDLELRIPDDVENLVIAPVLREMVERETPFNGLLYAGLMMTDKGVKVLEYNVRFGDPETQSVMRLIIDDMLPLFYEVAAGGSPFSLMSSDQVAVSVVVAANGYPEGPKLGGKLDFPKAPEGIEIFPAGLDSDNKACGGRVVTITSKDPDLDKAVAKAISFIEKINYSDKMFRPDIGSY